MREFKAAFTHIAILQKKLTSEHFSQVLGKTSKDTAELGFERHLVFDYKSFSGMPDGTGSFCSKVFRNMHETN